MNDETLQSQIESLIQTDEDVAFLSAELLRELRKKWLEEAVMGSNRFVSLYYICLEIIADPLRAEEALSDAVLAAMIQIDDGRCRATTRRRFFAWVRKILRFRCYSKLREAGVTRRRIRLDSELTDPERTGSSAASFMSSIPDYTVTVEEPPSELQSRFNALLPEHQEFLIAYLSSKGKTRHTPAERKRASRLLREFKK